MLKLRTERVYLVTWRDPEYDQAWSIETTRDKALAVRERVREVLGTYARIESVRVPVKADAPGRARHAR